MSPHRPGHLGPAGGRRGTGQAQPPPGRVRAPAGAQGGTPGLCGPGHDGEGAARKGDVAAAKRYAEQAKAQYPGEAQAHHLSGIADLGLKRYEAALEGFSAYERLLPGNPNTIFLKGVSLEGMNRQGDAAREYYRYLQSVKRGDKAQYAYRRLVGWGVIRIR